MKKLKEKLYEEFPEDVRHEKVSKEPSLTVPDESLSIQEILVRFTRGTLPPIEKQPRYEEDQENMEQRFNSDSQFDDMVNDPSYIDDAKSDLNSLLESQASDDSDESSSREVESSEEDDVNPPPTPGSDGE